MIHYPIGANASRAPRIFASSTGRASQPPRIGLLPRNCGNRFDDLTVKARGKRGGSNDSRIGIIDYFF